MTREYVRDEDGRFAPVEQGPSLKGTIGEPVPAGGPPSPPPPEWTPPEQMRPPVKLPDGWAYTAYIPTTVGMNQPVVAFYQPGRGYFTSPDRQQTHDGIAWEIGFKDADDAVLSGGLVRVGIWGNHSQGVPASAFIDGDPFMSNSMVKRIAGDLFDTGELWPDENITVTRFGVGGSGLYGAEISTDPLRDLMMSEREYARDERGRFAPVDFGQVSELWERIRRHPDGFTINVETGGSPRVGFVVATQGHSAIVDGARFQDPAQGPEMLYDYIESNLADIKGRYLGGWLDTEHNEFVLDICDRILDEQKAIIEGAARNQQAIFDLAHGREIPTHGTGDRETAATLHASDEPLQDSGRHRHLERGKAPPVRQGPLGEDDQRLEEREYVRDADGRFAPVAGGVDYIELDGDGALVRARSVPTIDDPLFDECREALKDEGQFSALYSPRLGGYVFSTTEPYLGHAAYLAAVEEDSDYRVAVYVTAGRFIGDDGYKADWLQVAGFEEEAPERVVKKVAGDFYDAGWLAMESQILAGGQRSDTVGEALLAEREYVRDERGRFAPVAGEGRTGVVVGGIDLPTFAGDGRYVLTKEPPWKRGGMSVSNNIQAFYVKGEGWVHPVMGAGGVTGEHAGPQGHTIQARELEGLPPFQNDSPAWEAPFTEYTLMDLHPAYVRVDATPFGNSMGSITIEGRDLSKSSMQGILGQLYDSAPEGSNLGEWDVDWVSMKAATAAEIKEWQSHPGRLGSAVDEYTTYAPEGPEGRWPGTAEGHIWTRTTLSVNEMLMLAEREYTRDERGRFSPVPGGPSIDPFSGMPMGKDPNNPEISRGENFTITPKPDVRMGENTTGYFYDRSYAAWVNLAGSEMENLHRNQTQFMNGNFVRIRAFWDDGSITIYPNPGTGRREPDAMAERVSNALWKAGMEQGRWEANKYADGTYGIKVKVDDPDGPTTYFDSRVKPGEPLDFFSPRQPYLEDLSIWDAIVLFDPDQPRDENGRFVTTGRAEIRRELVGCDTPEQVRLLLQIEGLKVDSSFATELTIHNARYAAEGFLRAKEDGWPVPLISAESKVWDRDDSYVMEHIAGAFPNIDPNKQERIVVNGDANLADAAARASGFWAGEGIDGIVRHELGHSAFYAAGRSSGMDETDIYIATFTRVMDTPGASSVAAKVSGYAGWTAGEFCSEVIGGLATGKHYDSDVIEQFHDFFPGEGAPPHIEALLPVAGKGQGALFSEQPRDERGRWTSGAQSDWAGTPTGKEGFRDRVGRCYELSGRCMLEGKMLDGTPLPEDRRLVHGTIQGASFSPNAHAWVEYTREVGRFSVPMVYDPVIDSELPKDAYTALYRGVERVSYDFDSMAKEMLTTESFGPWDKAAEKIPPPRELAELPDLQAVIDATPPDLRYWRRPHAREMELGDIERVDSDFDRAQVAIVEFLTPVLKKVLEQLGKEAVAVIKSGDITKVQTLSASHVAELGEALLAGARAAATMGKAQIGEAYARQTGAKLAVKAARKNPRKAKEYLKARTSVEASRLGERVTGLIQDSVVNKMAREDAGEFVAEVEDKGSEWWDFVNTAAGQMMVNVSRATSREALGIGRMDGVYGIKAPVGRVYYSAILDKNVCDNCLELDTQFGMGTEGYSIEDMGKAPNDNCTGVKYGNECRCIEVIEFEGDSELAEREYVRDERGRFAPTGSDKGATTDEIERWQKKNGVILDEMDLAFYEMEPWRQRGVMSAVEKARALGWTVPVIIPMTQEAAAQRAIGDAGAAFSPGYAYNGMEGGIAIIDDKAFTQENLTEVHEAGHTVVASMEDMVLHELVHAQFYDAIVEDWEAMKAHPEKLPPGYRAMSDHDALSSAFNYFGTPMEFSAPREWGSNPEASMLKVVSALGRYAGSSRAEFFAEYGLAKVKGMDIPDEAEQLFARNWQLENVDPDPEWPIELAEWDEGSHPRDERGRFTSGGGMGPNLKEALDLLHSDVTVGSTADVVRLLGRYDIGVGQGFFTNLTVDEARTFAEAALRAKADGWRVPELNAEPMGSAVMSYRPDGISFDPGLGIVVEATSDPARDRVVYNSDVDNVHSSIDRLSANNFWESEDFNALMVHELGHVAFYDACRELGYNMEQARRLGSQNVAYYATLNNSERYNELEMAKQVSNYAMTNGTEFCSEVLAGLASGKSYGDEVLELFGKLWPSERPSVVAAGGWQGDRDYSKTAAVLPDDYREELRLWEEDAHPRDERGRFTSGGASTADAKSALEAAGIEVLPGGWQRASLGGTEYVSFDDLAPAEAAEVVAALLKHQEDGWRIPAVGVAKPSIFDGMPTMWYVAAKYNPDGSEAEPDKLFVSLMDKDLSATAEAMAANEFWASDSVEGLVRHELTHAAFFEAGYAQGWRKDEIDRVSKREFQLSDERRLAREVSTYAVTNVGEFCSEFMAARAEGRHFGEYDDDIVELFTKKWPGWNQPDPDFNGEPEGLGLRGGEYPWLPAHIEAELAESYNPDQPRDEHGRWTSGGGSGSSTDIPQRVTDAEQAISALESAGIPVNDEHLFEIMNPDQRVRLANALLHFQEQGLEVPAVRVDWDPNTAFAAYGFQSQSYPNETGPSPAELIVHGWCAPQMFNDSTIREEYDTGWWQSQSTEDVILHELIHAAQHDALTGSPYIPLTAEQVKHLEGQVFDTSGLGTHMLDLRTGALTPPEAKPLMAEAHSNYAFTNRAEFVAEMGSRTFRGEKLSEPLMELLKDCWTPEGDTLPPWIEGN